MSTKIKAKHRSGFLLLLTVLPALFLLQACPKIDPDADPDNPDAGAKRFLLTRCMNVYYYWRDEVMDRNASIDASACDIYAYFDTLLYAGDRWSWMCDREYYVSDETGVLSGTWGVSMGQAFEGYDDYGLRVRYIHPGSPLERFGITRGAELRRIGNVNVAFDEEGFSAEKARYFQEHFYESPQNFTFRLTDGRDTTFTAAMTDQLSIRSSLIAEVFRPGDYPGLTEPVGYFHYLSFKAGFLDDIEQAMRTFRSAGVRKLIVDLRYNGGGDARASELLVNCLAPASAVGKPYVIRKHNDYLAQLDKAYTDEENTYTIGTSDCSLTLDGLYFITGAGTASASEMVINGLKPYYGDRLQMVGDTTYGKPNGMYVILYPGTDKDYAAYEKGDYSGLKWAFLPICFFNQNALGQLIPQTGFIPDNYRPDDLFHDFGVEEESIRTCLARIVGGAYPPFPVRASSAAVRSSGRSGYRIDTEEDSPRYGRYTAQKAVF